MSISLATILRNVLIISFFASLTIDIANSRLTFEKMTNVDYPGTTYYTIRNVSLYECIAWCRDDVHCSAASFSFVVNRLAPIQETKCLLQNHTQANKPSTSGANTAAGGTACDTSQKAINTYFLAKAHLRSENACNGLWSFERFPNKVFSGIDKAVIYTSNKEACLAACLNEGRFVCRSVQFNYLTLQCHLSEYDRRNAGAFPMDLVETQGVDYFENACLKSDDICRDQRAYVYARLGMPLNIVAHYVELNYYADKELMVKSRAACLRACTIENQFICRSALYRASDKRAQLNCALFHFDHKTFPDSYSTANPLPLLDSGKTTAVYLEMICTNQTPTAVYSQQTAAVSTGKPSIMSSSTQSPLWPTLETIVITIGSNTPVRDDRNAELSSVATTYRIGLYFNLFFISLYFALKLYSFILFY